MRRLRADVLHLPNNAMPITTLSLAPAMTLSSRPVDYLRLVALFFVGEAVVLAFTAVALLEALLLPSL